VAAPRPPLGEEERVARFTRLEVLTTMLRSGVVPLFHHREVDTALAILDALVAGGARVVEFTNRGDGAHQVFDALEEHARERAPGVAIGAGSIVDAGTASLYLNLGAAFVVAPTLDVDVARVCNRRKVAYLPGCATATEVGRAEELGCEIVKLFPGDAVGGPGLVKALRGPSPWSRFMPTGGVEPTEASMSEWFAAGASCVGLGSRLVPTDDVREGNFGAISRRMREAMEIAARVRAPLEEVWV
jgi:2-dehydro-3-deoxyphosphogluconate aldolase / (4S)-4-hydroxy-2-oxoglutarate aldolase